MDILKRYDFDLFSEPQKKPQVYRKSPGDIPMKKRAARPKKRSMLKRIAAFLAAGALVLGTIHLVNEYNKVPEESETVHNYTVSADNIQSQLENLSEEFSNISKESSSEEINAFAQDLYSFNMSFLKNRIKNIYNINADFDANSIKVIKSLVDSGNLNYSYKAILTNIYGNDTTVLLRGNILEQTMDNIVDLQDFDVYHEGFDSLKRLANSTFTTLGKDFIISYDSDKGRMTSYELEKEKDDDKVTENKSEEMDR